jgi:hypothetical protein
MLVVQARALMAGLVTLAARDDRRLQQVLLRHRPPLRGTGALSSPLQPSLHSPLHPTAASTPQPPPPHSPHRRRPWAQEAVLALANVAAGPPGHVQLELDAGAPPSPLSRAAMYSPAGPRSFTRAGDAP